MRTDKNSVYQIVTDRIIEQLESVNPKDWNKPWFSLGKEPMSLAGKTYRGINRLLLSGVDDLNTFGTYKGWTEKDCQVKKGAKSQIAVFWKFFKDENKDTKAVMVRYYNVFGSSQVEGDYAEQLAEKQQAKLQQHQPNESAAALIDNYLKRENLEVKSKDHAYYSSSEFFTEEHIGMPDMGQFKSANDYYATFLHEMTHSTGHAKRLKREMVGKFGSQAYAFEELVAELGSAFLCGSIGLTQTPREDHAQYLASWLKVLKQDSKAIFTAASLAQKAADFIQGIEPVKYDDEEKAPTARKAKPQNENQFNLAMEA